uniref:C2 domain-containing protein n=1 Tax=Pseudo-nitzschia arenysensis TaxID=697910 RepID=A0A7R9ZTR4_9STRA|mmetsp:Transcript_270/g.596  ORF Transcript_270/g.596 Transcript_270/m.596 type:complete len:202 (+) Transcript_270:190-795(+)|eukprot:CAMPEP_0116143860 /NCGR_PEP_ID=MMETSP0329-20121206/15674_1 /TAXON_ID=697910 /ORGANISM="Pseudo-nitzschia arenysensis, Strain B593" /LENGTH=201 /DNA_ID=CAMNT_0003639205 /DNA_START=147 /DNA_END=752 /DNA_ORIENTATION=+
MAAHVPPKKFIKKHGVNMLNPEYLKWKKAGGKKQAPPKFQDPIDFMMVRIDVLEAKDLVGKDKKMFSKKKTSDPYVKVSLLCTPTKTVAGAKRRPQKIPLGETQVIEKNLNPTWNFGRSTKIPVSRMSENLQLVFDIFDKDKLSSDDAMGTVTLSALKWKDTSVPAKWYEVPKGSAKGATGEIKLKVATQVHRVAGLRPYL